MTTVLHGPQLARLLGRWQGGRSVPDYAALAATVRGLLTDGRLPLGVRLPAERELAQALRISRTTVSAALAEVRGGPALSDRVRRPGAGRPSLTSRDPELLQRLDALVAAVSGPVAPQAQGGAAGPGGGGYDVATSPAS